MKNLIIVLMFLFTTILSAQWGSQISNTNLYLLDVHFYDDQIGWAVGDGGVILKTSDGGSNWESISSGVDIDLKSVSFVDAQNGWAVGKLGTIINTNDGGTIWNVQDNGVSTDLRDLRWVYFTDSDNGIIVGYDGIILKTTNGGINWSLKESGLDDNLLGVYFVNPNTGWTCGTKSILKSTDGGDSWSFSYNNINQEFRSIFFINETIGWAVGKDYAVSKDIILKTADGGTTWLEQFSEATSGLRAISFVDEQTGWIVGYDGKILKTVDSGNNWIEQNSGTTENLFSTFFISEQNGWAVGSNGTILSYSNFDYITPIITYQPQNQSVLESQNAIFTCNFTGPLNKGYQWWRAPYVSNAESKIVNISGKIEGATTGQLILLNTTLEDNGTQYFFTAQDADFYPEAGSWVNSNVVTLSVTEDGAVTPIITFLPEDKTVIVGAAAVFTCYFSGPTNKGYQWWSSETKLVDGNGISGATTSQLIINETFLEDDGKQFLCETKDLDFYPQDGSWLNSNKVTLSVVESEPVTPIITLQPIDLTVIEGQTATFACNFTGPTNKGYQWWRKPWVSEAESKIVNISGKIEGATTGQLRILNASMEDNGTQYLCETKELDFYPEDGSWVNSNVVTLFVEEFQNQSLVAYYPFNGNADDESGNGFHGVVYGAELTEDRFGVVNSAYYFNGNADEITVSNANTALLEPEDELTLACFIKANSIISTQRIIRKSEGGQTLDGYYLSWKETYNGLEFFVDGRVDKFRIALPNDPYVGQWIHIAGTYSENTHTAKLYVNGEVVASKTNAEYKLRHTDDVLYIGNFHRGEGFTGFIDDVRIYNRALSEVEIQVLAAETFRRKVRINSPNGSENLLVGSTYNINWYSNEVNYVNIEYSVDNGETWIEIESETVSDGSYDWIIPDVASSVCKLRITDSQNSIVLDESDIVFSIYGKSLSLIAPNGSEIWEVGSNQYIRWASVNLDNVKLEYSINNGTSWEIITESTPSTGSFEWLIPPTLSEQCKLRISDATNISFADISENSFVIFDKSLTITSPNGGEDWEVALNQNITWNSTYIQNVKIEYSVDDGTSWQSITSSTVSDGNYEWSIPNSVSTTCLIKISDILSEKISDLSDGNFTISPTPNPVIILAQPNGDESLVVGLTEQILWSSQDIETVSIEYSIDLGVNWLPIVSNISATLDTLNWVVPNTVSDECLVRIFDVSNLSIGDTSNSSFGIFIDQLITPIITTDLVWIDTRHDGVELGIVDASGSSLNFGNIVSYVWTLNGDTLGVGINPTIELPSGTNKLVLTLTSDIGNVANTSEWITVYAAKLETEGPILSSVSQLGNKSLFVSSMDDKIYKFDSTGVSQWSILTGGSIQSTICIRDEGNIYVGSTDARFYAFDHIGVPRWDKAIGGVVVSSPSVGKDGNIFVGLTTGRLFSMLAGGEINWTVQVDGGIISSPSISNNAVYFGATDFNVYGVDVSNGELLYTYPTEDSVLSSPAIDKEGNVIIGANDGYLYKLDKELKLIWKYYSQGKIKSSPVIDNEGNIYFGSDNGYVYSISKDKDLLWKYNVGSEVNGNPSLSGDGSIFIGCNDGRMLVLSKSGKLLWNLQTEGEIVSAPLITKTNMIYIGTADSNVYILKDPNLVNQTSNLVFEWPTFKGNNQRTGYVWEGNITTVEKTVGEVPSKFNLSQNYPNPFNPSTIISYSIIKPSQVKLNIYDVLGKEVLELVNKEQAIGSYKVTIDASQLTSGIYFYRLQAGEFVETKKMILLK